MTGLPYLDAAAVAAACSPARAVAAVEEALRSGLDPARDPARSVLDLAAGQLLLMPAEAGGAVGVKVIGVAPANPSLGLPRIQGLYLLLDGDTLAPQALLDGPALTTLRTPAVSLAAIRPVLGRFSRPLRVLVFGAGPQALGHVATLGDLGAGPAAVTYAVRDPARAAVPDGTVVGTRDAQELVASADLVVCATTASTPLFDSAALRDDAVVVAVGSHQPEVRETDSGLARRAQVVVEDVATALREGGDVIMAVADGALDPADLLPMADVVAGRTVLAADRPVLFKGSGMAWQDLVVARAVLAAAHP